MVTSNNSPALISRSDDYPASWRGRVPKRVRMAKTVTPDFPGMGALVAIQDQEYDVWVNSHGAVAAIVDVRGKTLGLRPYEFEVIEWHESPDNFKIEKEPAPERIKINWKPKEPGLNLSFSGLSAGHYSTGAPEHGWVLYSRDGNGCWNQRTEREFPPGPGMRPIRRDGEWYWERL